MKDDPTKAQHRKQSKWIQNTIPYRENSFEQVRLHDLYRLLTCSCLCSHKTTSQKIYEMGKSRTERSLDVRNIIKSQDVLKATILTLISSKERRKLLRLQRRALVLEINEDNSSDSEDDFVKYKKYYR